jgi:hypothetical protein
MYDITYFKQPMLDPDVIRPRRQRGKTRPLTTYPLLCLTSGQCDRRAASMACSHLHWHQSDFCTILATAASDAATSCSRSSSPDRLPCWCVSAAWYMDFTAGSGAASCLLRNLSHASSAERSCSSIIVRACARSASLLPSALADSRSVSASRAATLLAWNCACCCLSVCKREPCTMSAERRTCTFVTRTTRLRGSSEAA